MLNSTQNTDLMLNGIEQIKTICLALMDDLDFYKKRPNPNRAYIDIKQKQIDQLFNVCNTFTNVYNNIENAFIDVNKKQTEWQDQQFKLEACSIYHGVSFWELDWFMKQNVKQVKEQLQDCFKKQYRQVPSIFADLIDKNKSKERWDKLEILLNKNGEVEYKYPEPPPIKYATEPVYDLIGSLQQLKNSQNQAPGTNGKN